MGGRLVGNNIGKISKCYSTGYIGNDTISGGLIGRHVFNVDNSLSNISKRTNSGGLIGLNDNIIINSFYNHHSGNPDACVGLGSSSGCTKIENNGPYFYSKNNPPMNSWDFINIWQENPDALPTLRGF